MKAKLLLAETATTHPDGTVSLLRMGITNVWGDTPPIAFQGVLVVRMEGSMIDKGKHTFEVRSMTADGAEFAPRIEGQFEVMQGGGASNLLLRFATRFPKHGEYTYAVLIDSVEQDRVVLKVAPTAERNRGT